MAFAFDVIIGIKVPGLGLLQMSQEAFYNALLSKSKPQSKLGHRCCLEVMANICRAPSGLREGMRIHYLTGCTQKSVRQILFFHGGSEFVAKRRKWVCDNIRAPRSPLKSLPSKQPSDSSNTQNSCEVRITWKPGSGLHTGLTTLFVYLFVVESTLISRQKQKKKKPHKQYSRQQNPSALQHFPR